MRPSDFRKLLFAIFVIANYAVFTKAIAQNTSSEESARAAFEQQLERERIATERSRVNQVHDTARKSCYQKFDVVSCQNQARDARNLQLADLKRQETALNDVQRRQKASERVSKVQDRTSPEQLLKNNEERADRIQKMKDQEARRKEREHERIDFATRSPRVQPLEKAPPVPQGKPRESTPAKVSPTQEPDRAQKISKAQREEQERAKDYAERRATLERRAAERTEKEKTKPASASLPIPPEAK